MRLLLLPTLLLLTTALNSTAALPEKSVFFPGLDEEAMRLRLDESDTQPMEGIWYYPAERITVGIERCPDTGHEQEYRLILLASDDLELLPGTVMGHLTATAVSNKYRLWLYCERDRVTLLHPMECVATTDDKHTTITFEAPHWDVKVRVNFARFLPTLFRGIGITPSIEKEEPPTGLRKIYPEGDGNQFNQVRYL